VFSSARTHLHLLYCDHKGSHKSAKASQQVHLTIVGQEAKPKLAWPSLQTKADGLVSVSLVATCLLEVLKQVARTTHPKTINVAFTSNAQTGTLLRDTAMC
jgi:hypothetical protein